MHERGLRRLRPPTWIGTGVPAAVAVLLAAGALAGSSAASATSGRSGLVVNELPPVQASAAPERQARTGFPLRVADRSAYRQAKAAAESRYRQWLLRHGSVPKASLSGPRTRVLGGLNAPGVRDPRGTPSDSTGSIGPENYVELVNSEIAVYNRSSLAAPTQTLDESSFVGDPSAATCDGQIQWDEQGQRWLYSALDCGATAGAEALYFGWSATPSPDLTASNWCRYSLSTGSSIEDYPKLGHDDTQVIIGTNSFDDTGGNYTGSHIFIVDKPAAGVTSCTSPSQLGSTLAEADAGTGFTPVPVNLADSSGAGYVVALDQGSDAQLDLYTIGRDGSGNNVVLGASSVAVPAFAMPAPVPQPGTSDPLDSLDGRLTQAVGVRDPATGQEGIWTQHTVAGSGGGPSVVRWYELTPGAGVPRQTGTVAGPGGSFAFNGAISPTLSGSSAAIFYDSGSSSRPADVRVQDRRADTSLGSTIEDLPLAGGSFVDSDASCPSVTGSSNPCRWGDYAGASPDPASRCLVWGTSQDTATGPDGAGTPQWGTQNAAVDTCLQYTLSVSRSGAGSGTVTSSTGGVDCGSTCSATYDDGTAVTLTATAASGSVFTGWSGDCSGTGTCTVTLSQARSVTATFLPLEELTVSKSGKGSGSVSSSPSGISCGSSCSTAYAYGTTVTLAAKAGHGSAFAGWSGACSGGRTCSVTMNAAQSVTAKFVRTVCVVPKLKGKPLRVARRLLRKAHCRPGKIAHAFSNTVKKGRVIAQKPKPHRRRKPGAKVRLVVSSGRRG